MGDPFASIPSAAQGLSPAVAELVKAPPLPGMVNATLTRRRSPRDRTAAADLLFLATAGVKLPPPVIDPAESPLERVNRLSAPLGRRRGAKIKQEALVVHTTTRGAATNRQPAQMTLKYDRRYRRAGDHAPQLVVPCGQRVLMEVGG